MFLEGAITGAVVKDLTIHPDQRGWLAELFRADELLPEFLPQMAYVSMTDVGVARGPHEHQNQADYFCFLGPSTFRIYLWDNRKDSTSFRHRMVLEAGEKSPKAVLVPAGVVHAYKNVGNVPGMVINCPNRLYGGPGRKDEVDEIRHESDRNTIFQID
ncbi:MAG: dTDP-4-dehydrorhamnose 3,5-epimerase family protein [Bacteroidota bacterium]